MGKSKKKQKMMPGEEKPSNSDAKEEKKLDIFHPPSVPFSMSDTDPNKVLLVCFDVETAFGNEISEIYQIGAIADQDDKILITMLPEGNIHWGVTKYAGTNVSTKYDQNSGRKYLWHLKEKREVPSVSTLEGWKQFMAWLSRLKAKHDCDKVVLAAHGNLDAPALLNNLEHYGHMPQFLACVDAFCDTFGFIKNNITATHDRFYPNEAFEAHNALGDAEALYKILLKKHRNSGSRLRIWNDIVRHTQNVNNSLEIAKYKVSRSKQRLGQLPNGIYLINSLVNVPNLNKVVFKNEKKIDTNLAVEKDTIFVALDIQLMDSQGLHSEIIDIAAVCLEQNSDKRLYVTCHGYNEDFLKEQDNRFVPIVEGLERFFQWLDQFEKVVIIGFKPEHRQWPSLVNHCYYHGYQDRLFKRIQGICDYKVILTKGKLCDGKCNDLDKIHRQLFQEPIKTHKSSEVIASMQRALAKIDLRELANGITKDIRLIMATTKKNLDSSLADDIAQGKYYPEGHIGNFRMPEKYLPESCN